MAERKVLNKYYPPDFDASKIRTNEKKSTRKICNVRMMLPMSVRCYTCGNYMYLGTKFNMKVETVSDEDYLGIKIYRFYFKCTRCYGEITFKTDPKNHDYVAETGASRNHEQWKDLLMAEEEYKELKKSEMKEDAMKSLEHRTYDSKREMDILDTLDQVKTLNRRQANVNYDELIEKAVKEKDKLKEEEDKERKEIEAKFKSFRSKRIDDFSEPIRMLNKKREGDTQTQTHKEQSKPLTIFTNESTKSDDDSDNEKTENPFANNKIGSQLPKYKITLKKSNPNCN